MIFSLKKRVLFILLIVAAAFAVYAPSLRNGYVWDDSALIQRDPFIRSWRLIPEGARHFLFADATASDFYRPIQRVTYTWDYAWGAFQPEIYHFDNILIHAAAAVFLFLFVERLLMMLKRDRAVEWAATVALLWAIHPLYTSAVCYISGRADPLAAMFGFCGLWLAVGNRRGTMPLAGVMFLCAIGSKESGVIFLPICIALGMVLGFSRKEVGRWVVVAVLIAAVSLALRLSAEHLAPPASTPSPWAARPIVALRAFAEYAGLLLAPVHLHMERDVLPFGRGDLATTLQMARNRECQTLIGAVLLGGFVFWMRWAWRRERAAWAGLVCFAIVYLPICGLFSLNASVAEHWLYVPGAFLLLAMLLSAARLRIPRTVGIGLVVAWGGFLGVRTYMRNPDWHDQRTFLTRTIADGGENGRMLINLGGLELTEGNTAQAIADLQKALRLTPDQPFGVMSLGAAYLHGRQYKLAREQFEKALGWPMTEAGALQDLAVVDFQQYRTDRADLLAKAAEMAPEDWSIQRRYIMHLAERGEYKAAITALRAVVSDDPWRADAWKLLGDLWVDERQYDLAERDYRRAVALDVHDDETARKLRAVEGMER
jgi:Flp pilus assembly protein TadD